MDSSSKPMIAFFGATGGCGLHVLALALEAGYPAVALARTPSKLTSLLVEQQKMPESVVAAQLQVVTGSATDVNAVKQVLSYSPALIVSGLGGAPKLQLSLRRPVTLDQPHICQTFTATLLTALRELQGKDRTTTTGGGEAAQVAGSGPPEMFSASGMTPPPFLVMISTAGLDSRRDVPLLLWPFYRWLLAVPLTDKRVTEELVVEEMQKPPQECVLSGFCVVRASMLTNGAKKGLGAVRSGWVHHHKDKAAQAHSAVTPPPGPAIGYTISRADVGAYIFETLIRGNAPDHNGRLISITY